MAEVLVSFVEPITSRDGGIYTVRACGRSTGAGTWEGWIEFVPVDGGPPIRSGRETTQPNREDTEYWASGLTTVYLEGALERALHPLAAADSGPDEVPAYDGPAPALADPAVAPEDAPVAESVLNPFSVYRKGEDVLRRQLAALSAWHLVNIILDHELSVQSRSTLAATSEPVLVELIVSQVKARASGLD
jgi:hypothetical protein